MAAQVVAAAFTARRETRRLRWDQDRHIEEARHARAQLFSAERRDLYSSYLRLAYPQIAAAVAHTRTDSPPEGSFRRARTFRDLEPELEQLRWDISLLGSPRVVEAVELSHALLLVVMLQIGASEEWPREMRHATAKDALARWQDALSAMRADLAGDAPPTSELEGASAADRGRPTGSVQRAEDILDRLGRKYGGASVVGEPPEPAVGA